jgi:formylglycine-generating enzyme required for sulfatase activity
MLTLLLALGVTACENNSESAVSVTGVTLDKTALSLSVGASETLASTVAPADATNKALSWASSNPAVATVDAAGQVTALTSGTTAVVVTTADGGYTATCTVTVGASVTGVMLDKTALSLTVGASETLVATIAPVDAVNQALSWASSNTAVAIVDSDGLVTAIAVGAADITVTTADGTKTATCAVTVTPLPPGTYTANGVSFDMVAVDGGTFSMGAPYDTPVHSVTLSSFSIGKTEVTQALWLAVMGAHNSTQNYGSGKNYPEYYVSWNDIVGTGNTTGYTVNGVAYKTDGFCYKLSQLVGRQFFLPTEAQWEYAARGGNKSNGYTYSGSNTIDDVAWYVSTSSSTAHTVGTKQANELGIYDMSGNVWEWCSDWYGTYSSSSQTNPTGASSGYDRVLRGGSWDSGTTYCRVAGRYQHDPADRGDLDGFRLASDAE